LLFLCEYKACILIVSLGIGFEIKTNNLMTVYSDARQLEHVFEIIEMETGYTSR